MLKFRFAYLTSLVFISPVGFSAEPLHILDIIYVASPLTEESLRQSQVLTKFHHDLLDIPFQKTHLSTQIIQQQDIQRIDQALNLVSGVFHQNNYGGGFWDNYSFRGFQGNPNTGVDTIRNGLSVNRGITAPRDMVNIESLDFLKGPSAALYGRGEVGGALNVTTKKPQWTPETVLNLRGTTQDEYRLSLEQTAPISDALAYRMAVAIEDNQSFRDHVSSQRLFVAPQLSWKLSESTLIDLDTEFTQHLGTFDRGITAVNNHLLMDPKTFTGEPYDGDMRVKDNLYQLRLKHELNDAWQMNAAVSYKDAQMVGYSTEPRKLQADLETLERQRRHRDYQTEDILLQGEVLGQIQLGSLSHELVLGAETGRLDFMQRQRRLNHSAAQPNWINIYDPTYGQFSPEIPLHTDSNERQQYFAFNFQDQIFLNHQWNILLGGRFEHVDQRFINHRTQLKDETPAQKFSPRIGLNYRPTEALSIYSNYGEAFSMNNGMGRTGETFAPETAKSYEIGAKYQWQDHSMLSIAMFDMTKKNVLMTDANDPNFEAAVGEVKSKGLEIDLHHQINDRVNVTAGYAYTDAKVSKDDILPIGSPLTNVPKHTAHLATNYDFWKSGQQATGVHLSLNYVDERSGDNPTNVANGFNLPAYTLVNIGGYYQAKPNLRYQLNIHNLFDEKYYLSSYSNVWVQPGEPVKASLSLQWKY
ncbi:ligand-gated channel protein (plasmid) [Acinetobacter sp. NCu2D-2]|nr:TonB-dependent siderophore receptor [Acinetobacter sp. NCu2D-2]ANF83291.1 ligand-gated channel protein [Acinetobacter sp. NCu2D-2]